MIGWVLRLNERYIVNPHNNHIRVAATLKDGSKSALAFDVCDLYGPQYVILLFFAFSIVFSPVNMFVAGLYCRNFIDISGGLPIIMMAEGAVYFVASASIIIRTASQYYRTIRDISPLRGSVRYGRFLAGIIIWPLGGVLGARYVLTSAFNDISCIDGGRVIDFIFYINSPFLFQMPLFVSASMAISVIFILLNKGA